MLSASTSQTAVHDIGKLDIIEFIEEEIRVPGAFRAGSLSDLIACSPRDDRLRCLGQRHSEPSYISMTRYPQE